MILTGSENFIHRSYHFEEFEGMPKNVSLILEQNVLPDSQYTTEDEYSDQWDEVEMFYELSDRYCDEAIIKNNGPLRFYVPWKAMHFHTSFEEDYPKECEYVNATLNKWPKTKVKVENYTKDVANDFPHLRKLYYRCNPIKYNLLEVYKNISNGTGIIMDKMGLNPLKDLEILDVDINAMFNFSNGMVSMQHDLDRFSKRLNRKEDLIGEYREEWKNFAT